MNGDCKCRKLCSHKWYTFRLVKQEKMFDIPMKCLLVVPEKIENSVFHMFHDTLLGAHYGPVNTYYQR